MPNGIARQRLVRGSARGPVLRVRRDSPRSRRKEAEMKCPKCAKAMKWEAYLLARRPDALRATDNRAPVDWGWHCRCGMWVYGRSGH